MGIVTVEETAKPQTVTIDKEEYEDLKLCKEKIDALEKVGVDVEDAYEYYKQNKHEEELE